MAQNKVPSLDKYGSASKTETEHTDKLDTKRRYLPLSSLDYKTWKNNNQKTLRPRQINEHTMIEVI